MVAQRPALYQRRGVNREHWPLILSWNRYGPINGRGFGMDDVQRDLGRMEAQLSSLTSMMDDVRRELREVNAKADAMKEDFDNVKGGWRVLIGVAAVLGGCVSWLASKMWGH